MAISENRLITNPSVSPDRQSTLACGEAVGSAGVAHWAELFGAVLERLEHATDVRPGVAASSDRTREVVLECAAALSQLRSTLVAEAEEARRYQSLQRSPAVARRASDIASTALERHSCPRSLRLGGSSRDDPGFLKSRLELAIADAASNGQSLALFRVDLGDLHLLVADHGPKAVAKVRRIVAVRLDRSVRTADIVSSTSGNGFAIAAAGLPDRAAVSHLAVKLLDAVSPALQIGALTLAVRPSIGITLCPEDANTASSMMQTATSAMHWALEQRCGYAYFDEINPKAASGEGPSAGSDPDLCLDTVDAAPPGYERSAFEAAVNGVAEPRGKAQSMLAGIGGNGSIAPADKNSARSAMLDAARVDRLVARG